MERSTSKRSFPARDETREATEGGSKRKDTCGRVRPRRYKTWSKMLVTPPVEEESQLQAGFESFSGVLDAAPGCTSETTCAVLPCAGKDVVMQGSQHETRPDGGYPAGEVGFGDGEPPSQHPAEDIGCDTVLPPQTSCGGPGESGEEGYERTSQNQKESLHDVLFDFVGQHQVPDFLFEDIAEEENCDPDSVEESDGEEVQEDVDTAAADEKSVPIYPGHFMTVEMSLMLIMLFSIVHLTSAAQLQDLLSLISCHCLQTHPALKSLHRFKSFFANRKSVIVKHFYCNHCFTPVDASCISCPNRFCLKPLTESKSKAYHLEIPIVLQMQNLFKRDDFMQGLKHKQQRRKLAHDNIEDIYDGNVYKELSKPGNILSYPSNISFTWNTDGVPVFKSSKMSLWPIYLMVNELPPKLRKKRENMICAGFWFGETKPFMASFCNNLHQQLHLLENEGVDVNIGGHTENVKAVLICGTADLPAKSAFLNMMNFNANYGCSRCFQKGSNWRTEKGGNIHVFPFQADNPAGPERTHQGCIQDAVAAVHRQEPVQGVRGPSFLLDLKYYDFVKCSGIDYMHGVLLGITKRFLQLWFTVAHRGKDFSLCDSVELIDRRLRNLKPPHFISRTPRSISEHMKFWKANELRAWLFYYSVPLVLDLLPPIYLYHYAAFAQAIAMLCQSSISKNDVLKAHQLLLFVVQMFGPLYGDQFCTMNVHSLVHLSACVQDLGPLWVYSCFAFESINGDILKLIHGTQAVELQIASAIMSLQSLPEIINYFPKDSQVYPFVSKMCKQAQRKCVQVFGFNMCSLGISYLKQLSNAQYAAVYQFLNEVPQNLVFYSRVILRHQVIHSRDYSRAKCRNSFTVAYISRSGGIKHGMVSCFLQFNQGLNALISPFFEESLASDLHFDGNFLNITMPLIRCVKENHCDQWDVVDVKDIIGLCVFVQTEKRSFVCQAPNLVEED